MGKVNEEQMTAAINAYLTNNMSLNQCVAVFGVKKTTLSDRINSRYKSSKQGPSYDSKMQKSIIETKDISLSLPAQQNEDTFIEKKKKSNRKTISTPDELIKCDKDVYSFKSTSSDEDRSALVSVINTIEPAVTKTRISSSRLSLKQVAEVKQHLNDSKQSKRKSFLVEDEVNGEEDEEKNEEEALTPEQELRLIFKDLEFIKLKQTEKTSVQKESICFECLLGNEDLLKCSGSCSRSIHRDCAGLIEKTPESFTCKECLLNSYDCFICKKAVSTKKCSFNECYRYYHDDCLKKNNLFYQDTNGKYTCALHSCATCIAESHKFKPEFDHNEATAILQPFKGPFYQCVECPVAYHANDFCRAAGSIILNGLNIICSKHFKPIKSLSLHSRMNVTWCFVCATYGDLIGCSSCPASYHLKCINNPPSNLIATVNTSNVKKDEEEIPNSPLPHSADSGTSNHHSPTASVGSSSMASSTCSNVNNKTDWQCEDCITGKRPVTGEIVWAKASQYRWWPGQVCDSNTLAETKNKQKMHQVGEFTVKFFGTHDYYCTNVSRCFSFHENDDCQKSVNGLKGKLLNLAYKKAEQQAVAAFKEIKRLKLERMKKISEQLGQLKSSKKNFQNYQFIKTNKPVGNVIVHRKNMIEWPKCSCDPKSANPCGTEDCLNRILKYECHPSICPSGDRCQNQRFFKRLYPKQKPFDTVSRGWGLKAIEDIKKGDFVNEYVGELIDEEECKRRLDSAHENDCRNFYFLTIDKDRTIDAGPKGNLCRFMNHCCDPNCETQKWMVNGDIRVGLFALVDIPAMAELTFNYNLDCLRNAKAICKCGAKNCSGFIGERPKNSNVLAETKASKSTSSNGASSPIVCPNNLKQSKRKGSETSSETQNLQIRSKSATPKVSTQIK